VLAKPRNPPNGGAMGCACEGRTCKETTLFVLGIATAIWGGFALTYSALLVFVGFAWTRGDVRSANLTVPLVLSSLSILAAGILAAGPGSGTCCSAGSTAKRRQLLKTALILRIVPIGLIAYVAIYVTVVTNNPVAYPPSPPTFPIPVPGSEPPYPPSYPPSPAFPPIVPYQPPNSNLAIDGFFNFAAWLSFAALVLAPIFEFLVLCELSQSAATKSIGEASS